MVCLLCQVQSTTLQLATILHVLPSRLAMDVEFGKENIIDGFDMKRTAPSPKKAPKKTRSSMGPGVLSEGRSVPLKEDAGNRRKVGIAVA